MKQTFDIAPPAGEQVIPQERLRAQTVEQRVDIPMPPIMASPLLLASGEPADSPEELRPQGRGLRELLDAGDDATSVLQRNTRVPPAPGEEHRSTFKLFPAGPRERPDAGDDATSVLQRNTRCSPAPGEEQWSTFKPIPAGCERPDAGDGETSVLPLATKQPAKNPRSSPRLQATTGPSSDDQACRDSADAVHRQGRRYVNCDAATGPSSSKCAEPVNQPGGQARRFSADAVHRQVCPVPIVIQRQVPRIQMFFGDSESPAGAVRRDSGECGECACDQAVELRLWRRWKSGPCRSSAELWTCHASATDRRVR